MSARKTAEFTQSEREGRIEGSTLMVFGYRLMRLLYRHQINMAHTYERIDKPRGEFFHTQWI